MTVAFQMHVRFSYSRRINSVKKNFPVPQAYGFTVNPQGMYMFLWVLNK